MWPLGLHKFCIRWSLVMFFLFLVIVMRGPSPSGQAIDARPAAPEPAWVAYAAIAGFGTLPFLLFLEGLVTMIRRTARVYQLTQLGRYHNSGAFMSRVDTYQGRIETGRDAFISGVWWTLVGLAGLAPSIAVLVRM